MIQGVILFFMGNEKDSLKKALRVFIFTLTGVVSVGIIILLLVSNVQKKSKTPIVDMNVSKWELIPETAVEDNSDSTEIEESDVALQIEIPDEDKDYTRIIETTYGDSVTIGFAGDILFDTNYAVGNAFSRSGNSAKGVVGDSLLSRMNGVDIMVVNNEFPYSDRGTPTEGKTYTFRAKPETARILNDMGVDLVGLANNHAYDYGANALLDSFDALDAVGVDYMGAGRNINEASHPIYYVTQNGMKIAFICATQIERLPNPDTKEATGTTPGVFRCLDDRPLLDRVKTAKEKGAFVVVFIHWGTEGTSDLDFYQTDQAKEISAAGADLIIGAHPHVLQKIDYVNDVPVVYSLGNYIFNSKTLDTCMIIATIDSDKNVSLQMIPAIQSGCTVMEAFDSEKRRILDEVSAMSPGIQIDPDGHISR